MLFINAQEMGGLLDLEDDQTVQTYFALVAPYFQKLNF